MLCPWGGFFVNWLVLTVNLYPFCVCVLVCDPDIEHSALMFDKVTASEVVSVQPECSE